MNYFFKVLFTPDCWTRDNKTDKSLDKRINELLDLGRTPVYIDDFHAKLGELTLWVKNYPWAYGDNGNGLPSRKTVFRLRDSFNKFEYKHTFIIDDITVHCSHIFTHSNYVNVCNADRDISDGLYSLSSIDSIEPLYPSNISLFNASFRRHYRLYKA